MSCAVQKSDPIFLRAFNGFLTRSALFIGYNSNVSQVLLRQRERANFENLILWALKISSRPSVSIYY